MKKSVEQQLIDFLRENYIWFSSGDLQRKVWLNRDGSTATPRSIVRRLEENAEGDNAVFDVSYGNKGAASYRIKQEHRKVKQVVERLPDNTVRVSYVAV